MLLWVDAAVSPAVASQVVGCVEVVHGVLQECKAASPDLTSSSWEVGALRTHRIAHLQRVGRAVMAGETGSP